MRVDCLLDRFSFVLLVILKCNSFHEIPLENLASNLINSIRKSKQKKQSRNWQERE